MENLSKAVAQIRLRIFVITLCTVATLSMGTWWLVAKTTLTDLQIGGILAISCIVMALIVAEVAAQTAKLPLEALGKAILHIAPDEAAVAAPRFDDLKVGREYVTNVAYQLFQIASIQDNKLLAEHRREATQASNIISHLPLPLLVFNKQQLVTFGSDAAYSYCGLDSAGLLGKPLYDALDLEFPSDFTLEKWVNDCQKNKATDTAYWRGVRFHLKDDAATLKQCDMAGYYNRDNPTGIEFIITLFDRSTEYQQDDQALSYMALAVHELRTPLTIMRGYIEVFQEELEGKLDPELKEFMYRFAASAQQLTAFVNTILSVAKVEENQLAIKLAEEHWKELVEHVCSDLSMRAKALGKEIVCEIGDDLPTVAADRTTIYEVLNNLLENALKYSGNSQKVTIRAYQTQDKLIETVVEDKGLGIPTSVLPTLFEKFHRNHRNRSQISGTGLGLYLSKAIVNAHGGDIWVNSKENEGTTVSFTLVPYSQVADKLENGDNDGMIRTAHGWIKNHSLYRR